jgi:CDP-6-deoxy-D-xylo-4-hexulose-3-dehydrase
MPTIDLPINLPLATSTWDEAEYEAIQRVVASGRFTMGPLVREFEESFATEFGAKRAVMVNSGSSANLLMVAAAVLDPRVDLNPGDEVIVPAVSWATTYYPLHQYGLTLKFVDIDADTLNVDLNQVEKHIGPNTKAVMAVNLLGNPLDFDSLGQICQRHGLVLLEDNCESMGSSWGGRSSGTFGLMGTFSTFFSHHISTMEGGVIVTSDDQIYEELLSLRAHGWTRELPVDNSIYPKTGSDFDDLFRFVLPGYNVRPLEMSGAIGLQQLAKLPALVQGRRENARHFVRVFSSLAGVRIQREVGESSWFGFSMVLEDGLAGRRHEVVEYLRRLGVEVRPIVAGNFTRNPVMAHLRAIVPEELPVADKIHQDGLFVGNHHYSIVDKIDALSEALDRLA